MNTRKIFPTLINACCIAIFLCKLPNRSLASELAGFTEPFRTLKVASDETGTVQEVFVQEGQRVEKGQELIKLNSEVHQAFLAIASQNMQAEGRLLSTQADLQLKLSRLEKLEQIRSEGFARQEEVDRAQAEAAIAKANVRSAEEDLAAKKLEHERYLTQIRRRTVTTPIDGIVTVLHKDQGEFVAPNSPEIVTVVQVDRLLANFTLTDTQANSLKTGMTLPITFSDTLETQGIIEFISPVMDAESGTVLVKICIGNPDDAFRSGQRCRVRLPD